MDAGSNLDPHPHPSWVTAPPRHSGIFEWISSDMGMMKCLSPSPIICRSLSPSVLHNSSEEADLCRIRVESVPHLGPFLYGTFSPSLFQKKNIFTLDKPLLVSSNGSSSWVALFYKGRSKPMVKTWFGSEGGPGLCQNEAGIALVLSSENKLCFAVKPPLSFTVRGHGWLMPPINVSFCLFTGAKCTANAFWPREASALFGCACVK